MAKAEPSKRNRGALENAEEDIISIGADPSDQETDLGEFHAKFKEFQFLKETLRNTYETTKRCFELIIKAVPVDKREELRLSLLSAEDETAINRVITKDATILILGQTNSGKSSLANELLGKRYLPTSEVPCTSRIVNLRYSDAEYVRIVDSRDAELKRCDLGHHQRISKKFIVVDGEERERLEAVQTVVEVGLRNPLLKSGVRLVDAPGLSENKALDRVVRECVDGVLQLIIYVIDGNYGLRLEDRKILGSLYDVAPELSIFYVCNKIERHIMASKMDKGSDESSGDDDDAADDDDDDNQRRPMNEKRKGVFRHLVESGYINADETLERCKCFHAISTREIRKSRKLTKKHRKSQSRKMNEYSEGFDRMKTDFLHFAGNMLKGHISYAAGRLLQAQKHCFDFFVVASLRTSSHDINRHEEVQAAVDELKQKQAELRKGAKSLLRERELNIRKMLQEAREVEKSNILKSARDMDYTSVKVGDSVGKSELIDQLEHQVQRLVIMKVTHRVLDKINPEIEAMVKSMTEEVMETLRSHELVNQTLLSELQNVLTTTTFTATAPSLSKLLSKNNLSWHVAQSWMSHRMGQITKKLTTSAAAGVKVDASWREQVAEETLKRLNAGSMTEAVCNEIGKKIDMFYQHFDDELERVRQLNEISKMREDDVKAAAKNVYPSLCQALCKCEALINDIRLGADIKTLEGGVIKSGHRTSSYQYTDWKGEFKDVYIRKAKESSEKKETSLAVLFAISRHLPSCKHVLPLLSVLNDHGSHDNMRMSYVVPVRRSDLWTELHSDYFKCGPGQKQRVGIIGRNIADGCQFLSTRGFPVPDLRVTNIILNQIGDDFRAEINIIKPRDDAVPYPDGKPPFHIAPERYGDKKYGEAERIHSDTSDVYAFGLLLWWMVIGKYSRPSYAVTAQSIRSAVVERRETPLSDSEEKSSTTRGGLSMTTFVRACWSDHRPSWKEIGKWCDGKTSLSDDKLKFGSGIAPTSKTRTTKAASTDKDDRAGKMTDSKTNTSSIVGDDTPQTDVTGKITETLV